MINLNERVSESRQKLEDLSPETMQEMCEFLICEMGDPITDLEGAALEALQNNDYDAAKRFCLSDPCNSYLAAVSCIASAYRSPMIADSVLRDAARHTAEVVKRRAENRIAERFRVILCESNTELRK